MTDDSEKTNEERRQELINELREKGLDPQDFSATTLNDLQKSVEQGAVRDHTDSEEDHEDTNEPETVE